MIFGKTQKIMKTGILKYSKKFNTTKDDTQILIKANQNDGVNYTMCNSWKPKDEVSFKDIMDVRVDILGFEMMASPFLRKSVDKNKNIRTIIKISQEETLNQRIYAILIK